MSVRIFVLFYRAGKNTFLSRSVLFNLTKFLPSGKEWFFYPARRAGQNVVFSPNRKGDNKILTPKEENSVPRGEAARDRILLPAG